MVASLAVGLIMACGPMELPGPKDQAQCNTGKCDGFASDFDDFFTDMKKVDVGDLANLAVELGIDEINNQLDNISYTEIGWGAPEIFALEDMAHGDLTIHGLNKLTAGLTEQYGERAFVTRINRLRAKHLEQHPNKVWAEASFKAGPQLNHSESYETGGLTGSIGVRFSDIGKMTVIAPYQGEMQALVHSPVDALKSHRNFFMPPSVEQMLSMVPGESLNKQDRGTAGFNLGINWPIYIATVATYATIHAVLYGGAGVTATGQLDIQLIRDEGQTIVIDVGLAKVESKNMHLGIKSQWGIEGLPSADITVAGKTVDASKMAEKALERLLNKKLQLFDLKWSNDKQELRHSIARFSFDLSKRNTCMDQALIQAWRGDVRLAQGLANGQPCNGVTTEGVKLLQFLDRQLKGRDSYFGLSILSMRFFTEKKQRAGSVIISDGNQAQQILFDELEKGSGSFFSSDSYRRRTLVSYMTQNGRMTDADYNLHVQIKEKNGSLSPRTVMDRVNPLMSFFFGQERYMNRLLPIVNKIRWHLNYHCAPSPHDEDPYGSSEVPDCQKELYNSPQVVSLRNAAINALAQLKSTGIQGGMDPNFDDEQAFVDQLFELIMAAQTSPDGSGIWPYPDGKALIDMRFSQKAVGSLLTSPNGPDRLMDAIKDMIYTLKQHGRSASSPINSYQHDRQYFFEKTLQEPEREGIYGLSNVIADQAESYRRYANLSDATWNSKAIGYTSVGNHGHLLVVKNDNDVSLASVAERKAAVATKLFDKLVDKLGDTISDNMHEDESQLLFFLKSYEVIGYALLNTTQPSEIEMLVKMNFDNGKYTKYPKDVKLYGRGQNAKIIGAGEYSLDRLIGNN